jgi:glycosyltransferase involved in cell wall biosynthesis
MSPLPAITAEVAVSRPTPERELPLVSVVTPSFNQGAFLEATILSVLGQDYPKVEYLIMDGGSTDGSQEIIRRYADRLAYWTSERDHGQAEAINRGFAKASGEVLAWLNSDDTYEPGAVRAAVETFADYPDVDALYGDCAYVDQAGALVTVFRGRPFDLAGYLCTEGFIHQPTVFLRRRVLERVGPLDPSFALCLDYEYWLRMATACRWFYLPRVLARFRMHPAAKSAARRREFLDERLRCLDRLFADPKLPAEVSRARKQAYAVAYVSGGVHSYEAGELREAWRRLLAALKWDPTPFHWWTLKAIVLMLDLLTGLRVGKRLADLHLRGRWGQGRGVGGAP